jgi:hypothetical protein
VTSSETSTSESASESSESSETSDTASLDVIRTGKKRLKESKKDEAEIATTEEPEREKEREPKQSRTKKLKVIKDKLTLLPTPKELQQLQAAQSLRNSNSNNSNDGNDGGDAMQVSESSHPPSLASSGAVIGSTSNSLVSNSATSTTTTTSAATNASSNASTAPMPLSASNSRAQNSTYTMKERSAKSKAVQYEKPQKITENGIVTFVSDGGDAARETKPGPRAGKGRPKNVARAGEKANSKAKEAAILSAIDSDTEDKVIATGVKEQSNNNSSNNNSSSSSILTVPRLSKVMLSHKKKDSNFAKNNTTRSNADGSSVVKISFSGEKQQASAHSDALNSNYAALSNQHRNGEGSDGTNAASETHNVNTSDGDAMMANGDERSTLSFSMSGGTSAADTRAEKERALLQAEKEESGISLADLDLSHCERLESSYWRCPAHYELKKCSGRTSLCDSVLNDTWISRPTGEEGSQFRYSYKNAAEEEMFRV